MECVGTAFFRVWLTAPGYNRLGARTCAGPTRQGQPLLFCVTDHAQAQMIITKGHMNTAFIWSNGISFRFISSSKRARHHVGPMAMHSHS